MKEAAEHEFEIDARIFDKKNPVKAALQLFCSLIDEMDDIRENLRVAGLPLRTTRMIVELGVQGRSEERDKAIAAVVPDVADVMDTDELTRRLDRLVLLEGGYTEARSLARERDLNVQLLGMLTQIVQQNPGDGGQNIVSTFVAYALACDISLDNVAEVQQAVKQKSDSVLPNIDRKRLVKKGVGRKQLLTEIAIGCLFAVCSLWLVAG